MIEKKKRVVQENENHGFNVGDIVVRFKQGKNRKHYYRREKDGLEQIVQDKYLRKIG